MSLWSPPWCATRQVQQDPRVFIYFLYIARDYIKRIFVKTFGKGSSCEPFWIFWRGITFISRRKKEGRKKGRRGINIWSWRCWEIVLLRMPGAESRGRWGCFTDQQAGSNIHFLVSRCICFSCCCCCVLFLSSSVFIHRLFIVCISRCLFISCLYFVVTSVCLVFITIIIKNSL